MEISHCLIIVPLADPTSRSDLNPDQSKESAERDIENTEHMEENSASAIATPIADNMQNVHSQHHMLKYLRGPVNSCLAYNATAEERLATSHRAHEANQGGAAGEEVGERLSRNQLTVQLSNRFRISTRRDGINGSICGGGGNTRRPFSRPLTWRHQWHWN